MIKEVTVYINKDNVSIEYERFKSLVDKRKTEFDIFINKLENETSWLTSPASTRFHLCEQKGLLIHSVGVTSTLLEIKNTLMKNISDESCVIVGLFHDLGKIGTFGKELYIKVKDTYVYNNKVVSMGLATRSLYLVSQYITLTDDEAQAIAYHDGQYVLENKVVAHKESSLTLLLHYADYWTAHMYEDKNRRKELL
ncbi:MAG: HD domain-containing protein [Candidatus Atribacteria bacterium]|nr:MAG: HD domain-containing protein [Candidatus Atribacteria bacterium]